MAGVEVKKTTVSAVAHQSSHYDEERRKTANHANKHIDQTKSHLNYNLGGDTWREIMQKAREQVKELDKAHPPQRKKADRKTMATTILYCPNEIAESGKSREFFERVYEEYEKAFPGSMMGMQVHVDECHEYIDPTTKQVRMSMEHAHCFIVPNDKEKGCNMRSFLNRGWYKKVNELCEEVAKELGGKYHTGEGHHEDRSVEQMKIESAKELDRQLATKKEELLTVEIYTQETQETLQKVQKGLLETQGSIKALTEVESGLKSKIEGHKEELADITLNRQNFLLDFWAEIKTLWRDLTSEERRQERLERKIERKFGSAAKEKAVEGATVLSKNAKQELGSLMEQETVDSVHLDEVPGIARTRNAIASYKEELDLLEDEWELG